MNKVAVVIALGVLISVGVAQAYETGTSFWHDHSIPDAAFVDTDTDTDTQRQDWGAGAGIDVIVAKPNWALLDEVKVENRYDVKNREYRGYVVATIDLVK